MASPPTDLPSRPTPAIDDPATPPDGRELRLELPFPLDLDGTFRLARMGPQDPTFKRRGGVFWRASWTPEGPGTLALAAAGAGHPARRLRARAWGPGSRWLLREVPRMVGFRDRPEALDATGHRRLERLVHRHPGMRIGAAPSLVEALVPIVLQQRVTWGEAVASFLALVYRHGERAPGPHPTLRLPVPPARLARLSAARFHAAGVEASRSEPIRRVATLARHLEAFRELPLAEAKGRLLALPGIGPWTVGMAAGLALGDPDAVPVGDYHLPSMVAWNLAREPRADDARMLALLAPWQGQRWRVIRLLVAGGLGPPRRGPKRGPNRWMAQASR